jgi:spore germination cell wall hydrolase CwlJ-like protein
MKKIIIIMMLVIPSLASASEVSCLSQIMWSEAQGESLSGVASIGSAAINRAKRSKQNLCKLSGVTYKPVPAVIRPHFLAMAKSSMANKSIVGDADSWERSKRPNGKITARIGRHTFYRVAGL